MTYHGKYQQFQADVDVPTKDEKPLTTVCFRYHRMCPFCRRHQLDDLVEEVTHGEGRGRLRCESCQEYLDGFFVFDSMSQVIIGTVNCRREDAPVGVLSKEESSMWLKKDNTPIPDTPAKADPFNVAISEDEYMALPWTVQHLEDKWHCPELDVTAKDPEAFDLLCATECRMQLSYAVDGKAPRLPAGYRWKNGKPSRDPGIRTVNTRRF